MATNNRGKLYVTTLLSGVVSIASYVLLFTHQEWVICNFTRGGVYAALPIVTAFWFSFVHGTFTNCLLQALGFRAAAGAAADTKRAGNPSQEEVQT